MLKRRRRSEENELLVRQEVPPVALPKPPEKPKRVPAPGVKLRIPRPPAQPPLPAGVGIPAPPPLKPPEPAAAEIPPSDAAAPVYHRKRRRGVLLILRPLAILAVILVAIYLALPFVLRADRFRSSVEGALSASLGRKVEVGKLQFTLGLGGLIASDVSIAEDPGFGAAPFARAREARFDVSRLALLLDGNFETTAVEIAQPRITLERNTAGRWNFSSILTGSGAPQAAAPKLRIRGGTVTIRAGAGAPLVFRDVSAEFQRFSIAAESVFTIAAAVEGGGTVKLNGKAGPVIFNPGAPTLPMSVLVNARKVALFGSNLTAAIAPALDGVLTFDGAVESDGAVVTVNGNASIARLKLSRQASPAAEPVLVVFTVRQDLATGAGEIKRGEIHLGKGSADIKGGYSEANGRTTLKASLESRGVPAPRIAGLLGAAAIPLPAGTTLQGGVGFASLAIDGPLDSPAAAGSIRIDNAKLTDFDLQERLSTVPGFESTRIPRDLAIGSFTAKVNAGPERITLEELEIELPDLGNLKGAGSISDSRMLELRMEAVRRGADRRPVPFIVHGPCSAPVFRQPGKI